MANILHVAEKPSVAKSITEILSCGQSKSRSGFSKYDQCFDFQCDVAGQRSNMIVTSVSGHIMGLDFDDAHRQRASCDPVAFFEVPVFKSVLSDKEQIVKTLKRESLKCQQLVLWLDCDGEGENIAFEVMQVCLEANPRLTVKRARFSSLVTADIWCGLNQLVAPNSHESDAVDARREIDLRIGAAFTRFQTTRIQKRTAIDTVVSYGPCQFPMLGFVVDAWHKRQTFVAEDFWSIRVEISINSDDEQKNKNFTEKAEKFKKFDANGRAAGDYIHNVEHVVFIWERGKLFDRVATLILYELCLENPLAVVESVTKKETWKCRPNPLETIELLKRCSRWLRLTSYNTMNIAKRLYQNGWISYPRTETNRFPNGLDLRKLLQHQTGSSKWGQYAAMLLNHNAGDGGGNGFEGPNRGKKDDQAHPPIHPTRFDQDAFKSLKNNEQRVFEFVVRHFLACCSQNAKGYESKVTINIAGEEFSTTGLIIFERNFLDIYVYEKWKGKVSHEFLENQSFMPDLIDMSEGKTSAPELLNEEQLISLMDKNGIGTDATKAEHIEKILECNYVNKVAHRFVPENLGVALCGAYKSMGNRLDNPFLRSNMEHQMKQIALGQLNKDAFLTACLSMMKRIFLNVQQKALTFDHAILTLLVHIHRDHRRKNSNNNFGVDSNSNDSGAGNRIRKSSRNVCTASSSSALGSNPRIMNQSMNSNAHGGGNGSGVMNNNRCRGRGRSAKKSSRSRGRGKGRGRGK